MTGQRPEVAAQLQRALVAVEKAQAKIDALENARSEPIAVVGIGCRFPIGGRGPEAFWSALASGADGVRELGDSRWAKTRLNANHRGTKWAGLVDGVDQFDPTFFGIAPREAMSLDPQQRFLLETTWEAFEDAGIVPRTLMGSTTGVFVGISSYDYLHQVGTGVPEHPDLYALTGVMTSNAAGRLSFVFGFQGPAMAVDTACSSSLVAVHLACQSLRAGESCAAIAAGVNLILAPHTMAAVSATQALSPDGRSRAFDAEANGFVRGEGCGVVLLKRLSDAVRDGDRIRAVVRGSAVNQDGRSTGLTTPNVLAQQALLRRALANARVAPQEVGYVETHGTGTSLGDPIEYEALKEVYGAPRAAGSGCALGALKTNVGHLEAAAGVAGFIKAVLALEHGSIPRNLHYRTLNPHISLEGTPFVIPTADLPWPGGPGVRRAAVSSFGMSGTNAHAVLEEAPGRPDARGDAVEAAAPAVTLLPISSKTAEGLRQQARAYLEHLAGHPDQALSDVAHTAGVGRAHHAHRLAVVADTAAGVQERLTAFLGDETRPGLARGEVTAPAARIVFVFPGQGGQWPRMGRALLAESPIFRERIQACEQAMRGLTDWPLADTLCGEGPQAGLERVDVIQPAVFAMQLGLAALWRAWGVTPAAVIGHSMGEIGAAQVAGMLSLEDACRIVCVRSRLVRRLSGQGGMAVVDLPAAEVSAALEGEPDLSIAAVNGPRTTVVSGAPAALERLLARLEARGTFCRRISVDYASHSRQMDALKPELLAAVHAVRSRRADVPLYSTVTGAILEGEPPASYWQDNLREPVRFWPAVESAQRAGADTFIEINPHPILLPSIADGFAGKRVGAAVVPSLRRDGGGLAGLLGSLGELYARGYDVDFSRLSTGRRAKKISLPTYAWSHERCWTEPPSESAPAARAGHGWLGPGYRSATERGTFVWQGDLDVQQAPHLSEHRVGGATVAAGALWIEAALHAGRARGFGGLQSVELVEMLALDRAGAGTVQIVVRGQSFEVLSAPRSDDGDWKVHARGRFAAEEPAPPADPALLQAARARCPREIPANELYEQARARGLDYGERYAGLDRVFQGSDEALGELLVKGAEPGRWVIEPWLLDAAVQTLGALVEEEDATYLPVGVGTLRVFDRLQDRGRVHAARRPAPDGEAAGDVRVYDQAGRLVMEAIDVRLRRVRAAAVESWLYTVGWEEQARPRAADQTPAGGSWIVLSDGLLGSAVIQRLEAAGAAAVRIRRAELDRLAAALQQGPAPVGILHLWAAEDEEALADSISTAAILEAQRHGVGGALAALQALAAAPLGSSPRFWLVTRAAQAIAAGDPVRVTHAPLVGFARTLAHEHPELRGVCYDLPEQFDGADLDALVAELRHPGPEREIGRRGHRRFVARLGKPAPVSGTPAVLSPAATYLVTGGLGGLGLQVARFLVERGARHLLLAGRHPPGPRAQAALDALAAAGANVRVARADVGRPDDVDRLLQTVARDAPLRGVVHAAGVLADATFARATWDSFAAVFNPKVAGAWNLHGATRGLPLDFFVLFSSAAAVLGSPGQGNYASANAFVDALAHHRRAAGLPAVAVDWGPWGEVGLAAARDDRGNRLDARGVRSLSPAQGLAALEVLMRTDAAQTMVARLDLARWRAASPQLAELPFFSHLLPPAAGPSAASLRAAVRRELETLEPLPRRVRLEQYVITEMARVLRLGASRIHPSTRIAALGFDSLMALELRNRIEIALDVSLPASLLFTYRSVDALVPHLAEKMGLPLDGGGPAHPASPPVRRAVASGPSLADVSEDEAEAVLLAKLDELEVDAK